MDKEESVTATKKRFTPEQGKVYKNKGGGEFLCIQGFDGDAIMRNIASGWTFTAHGVIRYENGCIEWDYSTGGHFDCIQKHCRLCEAGFIGGGWMIRTNQRTNDYLCRVVERFQVHSKASKSDNPMVAEMALKMCEVEIWEMWVLTQE